MSAQEFGEWQVMFKREELHPAADRLRHAQLLAALHNGPMRKLDKSFFSTLEFISDGWAMPSEPAQAEPPTHEQLTAQVQLINARFEA